MLLPSLFSLCLLVLQSIQPVESFSFTTNGNPSSCDNLALTWTGGSPPFSLFVAPIFGTFRNVSIPANAQNNFNFQVPFAKGTRFTITMSDATGFATGGTTNLLETGASTGGTCNTVDPGTDFDFSLDSALQQCSPYPITGYAAAIQPVRIIGTIPGGQSFVLTPPQGPTAFSWTANVAAGTGIIFSMTDAANRNGGSSDIKTVGLTNNNACLNANSPSSTSARPTATSTSATSKTATKTHASTTSPSATSSQTAEPEKKTSIAAIAGTVIGALVFLAVAITLGLFFLRRRQEQQKGYGVRRKSRADVDLAYEPPYPPQGGGSYPYTGAAAASTTTGLPYAGSTLPYDSNPFLDQHGAVQDPASAHYPPPSTYGQSQYAPSNYAPSQYSSTYQLPSQFPQQGSQYPPSAPSTASDPFNPYMANQPPPPLIQPFDIHTPPEPSSSRDSMSVSMTSTQRKAAMAGVSTYTPSRFIMHTDAEDELPVPNSEGVVELPPQYTERRGPGSLATSSTPASAERPS